MQIGSKLDDAWRAAVTEEATYRSVRGQPVMVSVYRKKPPLDEVNGKKVQYYSDEHQIGRKEMYSDRNPKVEDPESEFARIGEVACLDDFYGRGYTFKFVQRDAKGEKEKKKKIDPKTGKVKEKDIKFPKGAHVLITSLPQNSRNLEQFLFRVARGGDKGSSSMIISPNDPVLIKHLERLQMEDDKADPPTQQANDYFEKVMRGELTVEQIVADIYPEQTKDILYGRVDEIDACRKVSEPLQHLKGEARRGVLPEAFGKRKLYRLMTKEGKTIPGMEIRKSMREMKKTFRHSKKLDDDYKRMIDEIVSGDMASPGEVNRLADVIRDGINYDKKISEKFEIQSNQEEHEM